MMRISTNWLKDYVNLEDIDLKELSTKITASGINIEQYQDTNIKNLVIGKILSVTKHENSDHLNICLVDIGNKTTQIVCGAPNVKENLKVIVALPNCILPNGLVIKKSTIRGVESNGMICALYELGLEEKTEENYHKGIYELPESAKVGENPIEFLNLSDVIYGLDLNPNRNDCLSYLGFAYQSAAVLNKEVTLPDTNYQEEKETIEFNLEVDTDNCPLYLAKVVKNITIKESPDFIQRRLINAGMRPINNVVDISNYIMLEYGQPLHFFDKTKIGDTIKVRMASDNEEIITLDNKQRKLNNTDIVITDGTNPICIAGVMGGKNSEVDENTKEILIESAIFNPHNVRTTSIRLDLRSEASLRYEKGLNYEYTYLAMKRACHLLEKYASGKVVSGIKIYDKINKESKVKEVTVKEINNTLGLNLTEKEISTSFDKLKFPYQLSNETFTVVIPNRRMDVAIKEDLIEEVASIYSYDHIPSILKETKEKGGYEPLVQYRKDLTKLIRSLGLSEMRNHTLISGEEASQFNYFHNPLIKIQKPMNSQKEYLRQSLIPSLINNYNYNKAHGVEEVLIYEIANTYNTLEFEELKLGILLKGNLINNPANNKIIPIDYYVTKGYVENILTYLGLNNRYQYQVNENIPKQLHPYASAEILVDNDHIGYLGKLHPNFIKEDIYVIELNLTKLYNKKVKKIKYKEPNIYPTIKKDVAFIINKDIESEKIIGTIKKNGGKLLTNIKVFDVYTGSNIEQNKKSLAFNLTFEDYTKTLTDEEVTIIFNKIISSVEQTHNAILRDN